MPRTTNRLWIGIIVLVIGFCYLSFVKPSLVATICIIGFLTVSACAVVGDLKRWFALHSCPHCKGKIEAIDNRHMTILSTQAIDDIEYCPHCKKRLKE